VRTLVESLKRLYDADKVSYQKLTALRDADVITEEEYVYIRSDSQPT